MLYVYPDLIESVSTKLLYGYFDLVECQHQDVVGVPWLSRESVTTKVFYVYPHLVESITTKMLYVYPDLVESVITNVYVYPDLV